MMSNSDNLWKTAGKKKKDTNNKHMSLNKSSDKKIDNNTSSTKNDKDSEILDIIKSSIINSTNDSTDISTLDIYSRLVEFLMDNMNNIIGSSLHVIEKMDYHQFGMAIIKADKYLKVTDSNKPISNKSKINQSLSNYNIIVNKLLLIKKNRMIEGDEFLKTHDMENNDNDDKLELKCLDDSNDNIAIRTYSSAALVSDNKPVINNKISDTNIAKKIVPSITPNNKHISTKCTLEYNKNIKTYSINMGKSSFTAGPSDFVSSYDNEKKNKHAKRCINEVPCYYKDCNFYHDPAINEDFDTKRNFTLGYVNNMLFRIKNSEDISNGDYDKDFLRDLIQLGGSILIKADELKRMYFEK